MPTAITRSAAATASSIHTGQPAEVVPSGTLVSLMPWASTTRRRAATPAPTSAAFSSWRGRAVQAAAHHDADLLVAQPGCREALEERRQQRRDRAVAARVGHDDGHRGGAAGQLRERRRLEGGVERRVERRRQVVEIWQPGGLLEGGGARDGQAAPPRQRVGHHDERIVRAVPRRRADEERHQREGRSEGREHDGGEKPVDEPVEQGAPRGAGDPVAHVQTDRQLDREQDLDDGGGQVHGLSVPLAEAGRRARAGPRRRSAARAAAPRRRSAAARG